MTDSSPKQEPPYGLRMPPDLKARVKAAAEASNRSMNAEICAALEEKYPAPEEPMMRLIGAFKSLDTPMQKAWLRRALEAYAREYGMKDVETAMKSVLSAKDTT
ncbi:MAG TPA: hypothetical protein DEB47_17725 [Citreicella sp.]|nr:hypothetical protein [Citreicella sp.]